MQGYLLDTSVASMFGPRRTDATPVLIEWMRTRNDVLHLSTVTAFEITQGIAKLTRIGAHERASEITKWRDGLVESFGVRVLPLGMAIATAAGSMSDAAFALGKHLGLADIFIAATARAHDLLLLTRNIRHFEPLGIAVADPLAGLPD